MGRPPLPPGQKLSKHVMVRFTEAEYEGLEAAAKGKPVSTIAREVLLRWAKGRRRR